MKSKVAIFIVCLASNLVLASVLIRHKLPSTTATSATAIPPTPTASSVASLNPAVTSESNDASLSPNTLATSHDAIGHAAPFDWGQLGNTNLVQYVAALRAMHTPEKQIKDIIHGELEAIYRPRRAVLRAKKPLSQTEDKFWERKNPWGRIIPDKEQAAQLRALGKEEAALLKSLMGETALAEIEKGETNNWYGGRYEFIPRESREKFMEITQQLGEEKQQIYENTRDDYEFQHEDIAKLEKKYRAEMAKILTPEQLLEYELRESQASQDLKNNLSAFDPSEAEYRALFKYQQNLDDVKAGTFDGSNPPSAADRKALQEKQKAMEADLGQIIGTNRVREYTLEQDYSYRNLIEKGVDKQAVFQLDDMKTQATDAAQKIRKDKTLSQDQRTAALSAIRDETESSMNQLLGDKTKIYKNNGGWWLNNLAPPKPVAPPTTITQ